MKNQPYQLSQKSDDVYELQIYGDIGESWFGESVSAKLVIEELATVEAKEIIVCINSYGGSVSDGVAIVNALQRHPAKIITRNEGVAVSIAAYIFMAGDERHAHENTLYMIHAPWTGTYGNSKEFREMADLLDKYAEAQINTFVAKAGISDSDVRELLTDGVDHWYTASEAKESGFVSSIIEQSGSVDEAFVKSRFVKSMPQAMLQKFTPKGVTQIANSDNSSARAEPTQTKKVNPMTTEVKASAEQTEQTIDVKTLQAEAQQAERARAKGINAAVTAAGLDADFAQTLIDDGTDINKAREMVISQLAKASPTISNTTQTVIVTEGGRDAFVKDVVQGVSARARVKSSERNRFSQFGFHDIARACCAQAGINTAGMSSSEVIRQALTNSTSDFPNIFENVMHKALMDQYDLAPHVWQKFCGIGDLSDFRAHNRYKPSSFGDLKSLQENGEFKNVSIGDAEKETISANSKGMIFNLTYEMIVNDDIGAFLSIARGLGRAAARSVEVDVFALLAANPAMGDGVALFHADHGNISTGAALSMSALDLDRVKMRKQKDPGSNDYLDISPAVLLLPVELGGSARQIVASETDPSKTNSKVPNIVRDMVEVVDTPRLSGTTRYLFANPAQTPAIEVGFLNGMSSPEIRTEEAFNSRGIKYRIAFDYGVAPVDYRAAIRNAGA